MLYFSYWHAPYEFLCLCVTDAPPNVGVECIWSTDVPSIFNVLTQEMIVLGTSWKRCKDYAPSYLGAVNQPLAASCSPVHTPYNLIHAAFAVT